MIDITQAIISLQPNAVFSCKNNDYNKIKWIDNSVVKPSYEEVLTEVKRLEGLEPLRLLREERDRRLTATDWRATIDYPGDDQAAWLEYRQALRDVTEQDPNNITWPEEP